MNVKNVTTFFQHPSTHKNTLGQHRGHNNKEKLDMLSNIARNMITMIRTEGGRNRTA